MTRLAGRSAIVSGASRGIGLAISRALTRAGARVTMLARGADELHARAAELGAAAIPCDVADAAAIDTLLVALRREGQATPDILVNNAGLFRIASVTDTAAADFRRSLEVNVIAPFLLVRAFLAGMMQRGSGHIVSIGSIADHTIYPQNGAYAASKHALRAFHDVLRAETRGTGVRVTQLSPGPVDTPLWDPIDPDRREGFTPRARMLSPDAVAAAAVYAVSQPPEVDIELIRLAHS